MSMPTADQDNADVVNDMAAEEHHYKGKTCFQFWKLLRFSSLLIISDVCIEGWGGYYGPYYGGYYGGHGYYRYPHYGGYYGGYWH